jgi:phosphoglucomutase
VVHTPLVPFGISFLSASAGLMITASHNPAADNGYKVYWSSACQIIPPHDKNIAASIEQNLEPRCWDENLVDTSPLVERPLDAVRDSYFACLRKINAHSNTSIGAVVAGNEKQRLRFVYTPMHGVGLSAMLRAAGDLGALGDIIVVQEQAEPDPDFPTVRFPNPEEDGALDLAISTANAHSVPFVLASDPDADRFAAAQRLDSGEWYTFTGNELGILFAAQILSTYRKSVPIDKLNKLCMLCSTVSSQMLKHMAKVEGFHFEEALTGFKWLGSRAIDLSSEYDAVYAFEEAIGYMFAPVVHDKDGVAAASVFITMARELVAQGKSPYDQLQELYRKYGHFQSANFYLASPDPRLTAKAFSEVRALGSPYPGKLGNRKVTAWRDLTMGYDSTTPDNKPLLPVSKSSEMITVELEGDVRFTVRGSGTEPKIKSELIAAFAV